MRCCHSPRWSTSVWRSRTRARRSSRCPGGIHASGSRPTINSSRKWRAAAPSVLAPPLLPRRSPRLGPPPDHQRPPQVGGVGAIGLGPPLAPAQAACLRRLGEVHVSADRPELFDDEPPTGRRLQRDFELLAGEAAQELTNA